MKMHFLQRYFIKIHQHFAKIWKLQRLRKVKKNRVKHNTINVSTLEIFRENIRQHYFLFFVLVLFVHWFYYLFWIVSPFSTFAVIFAETKTKFYLRKCEKIYFRFNPHAHTLIIAGWDRDARAPGDPEEGAHLPGLREGSPRRPRAQAQTPG